MQNIQNKVVIITGASSGIGEASRGERLTPFIHPSRSLS